MARHQQPGMMMQQHWQRQSQPQHHEQAPADGSMLAGLNHPETLGGYSQYSQHQQHHDSSHSYPDPSSLHREQYGGMGGGPQQAGLIPDAAHHVMHPHAQSYSGAAAAASHSNNPVSHYGNMNAARFGMNPMVGETDELLSMMLMASRQANVPNIPNMFNTLLNTNEQGESSPHHDSEMLRAYNQSLNILAQSQQQSGNFGDHATAAAAATMSATSMQHHHHHHQPFPSIGSQMPVGLRPSNNLTNSPPYPQGSGGMVHRGNVAGLNPRGNDTTTSMNALYSEHVPERIEPSAMGAGMLDIPYGIQQQRLLELGVGGEKRPFIPEHHEQRKSAAPPAKRKKKKRVQRKKPQDMPRRPLSAYNLFFSAERERILKEIEANESGGTIAPEPPVEVSKEEEEATCQALLRPLVPAQAKRRPHRKTHGKIGFRVLAQMVGQRWKKLPTPQRKFYQDLADKDMLRHKEAMEAYYKKQSEQKSQEGSEAKSKDTEGADSKGDNFEDAAEGQVKQEDAGG